MKAFLIHIFILFLCQCGGNGNGSANTDEAAGKEKQMARKVELNMELKRIEAAHASARAEL